MQTPRAATIINNHKNHTINTLISATYSLQLKKLKNKFEEKQIQLRMAVHSKYCAAKNTTELRRSTHIAPH